jgi:predicted component of type VI protein secretion system
MFDVGPSFSDGLFLAIDAHLVGLVALSLFVLLDLLSLVDLALLLRTIYAVMAGREPRITQTCVQVVVEAVGPVALPLLLGNIIPS